MKVPALKLNKNAKIVLALAAVIILLAAAMVGPSPSAEGSRPEFKLLDTNDLAVEKAIYMANADTEEEYAGAVALAPVMSRQGDDYIPLLWNNGETVTPSIAKYGEIKEIDIGSAGETRDEIACAIAEQYWTTIDMAIVVEGYREALLGTPVASKLKCPVLYSTSYTYDYLDTKGTKMLISIGSCKVPVRFGLLELESTDEVWNFQLEQGGTDYIIVTNPEDIKADHLPAQSLNAAVLGCEKYALVSAENYTVDLNWTRSLGYGTADAGSGERGEGPDVLTDEQEMEILLNISKRTIQMDRAIDRAAALLNDSGGAKYVAIVGSNTAVPMMYVKSPVWYEGVSQEEKGEEYCATDHYYGDLDIKLKLDMVERNFEQTDDLLYTQELAVGRVIGATLLDSSALIVRSIGYQEYEASLPGPWRQRGEIVTSWMCGDSDNLAAAHQQALFASFGIISEQEHPPEGWKIVVVPTRGAVGKMEEQGIIIYDGHGFPDGWYWTWISTHNDADDYDRIGAEDVWDLNIHATPVFGACCLSGALDWTYIWKDSENSKPGIPQNFISLAFIHAGAMGYIGATEESWGMFFGGLADGNNDAWGYGDFDMPTMMWEYILSEKLPVGEALARAKEMFYGLEGDTPFTRVCLLETAYYGEPSADLGY